MNEWVNLETFAAVANAGSMTAAAHAMGISQPTVSRRISALEAALGVPLFLRHGRGLTLTERGKAKLDEASAVDRHVRAFYRESGGADIEGTVRVSCIDYFASVFLVPCFARLRELHPDLCLEVNVDTEVFDLGQGEADIALRTGDRHSPDLIAHQVSRLELGLYASRSYLDAEGTPATLGELAQYNLVGTLASAGLDKVLKRAGLQVRALGFRSNSMFAQLAAVQANMGIGGLLVSMADAEPNLVRVLPDTALFEASLWLVRRRELRRELAVRTVFDAIRAAFSQRQSVAPPA